MQYLSLMDAKKTVKACPLQDDTRTDVERALVGLDVMLMQREQVPDRILGRIHALMGHYWVGKEDERSSAAKFMDWYAILKPFPFWAIDEACKEWLATSQKRPAISDIKTLTVATLMPPQRMKERLQIVSGVAKSPDEDHGKNWQDMTDADKSKHDEMMNKIKSTAEGMKP